MSGSVLLVLTGTLCALLGYHQFVANLGNFLNVLLLVFIPWSAINLTDFYLVRHGEYDIPSFFTPHGIYGGVAWRGLGAYLVAIAIEVPFIDQTFYTGPLVEPLGGVDISWVVGGVAGMLCYLIAVRLGRSSSLPDPVAAHVGVPVNLPDPGTQPTLSGLRSVDYGVADRSSASPGPHGGRGR